MFTGYNRENCEKKPVDTCNVEAGLQCVGSRNMNCQCPKKTPIYFNTAKRCGKKG